MPSETLERIKHLPASLPSETSPLSADVYAIRGNSAWWIFDVGACDEAVKFINSLDSEWEGRALKKNVVISHFHQDHMGNLQRIHYDNLYIGRETFRHIKTGTVVETALDFDDGIHIQVSPIPSSHAKGSLLLTTDEYAFLGDATYPTVGHGRPDSYNVQLLFEQIKFLKGVKAQYAIMSHKRYIPREKESIVQFLESVYATRRPNENLIIVNED